MQPPKGSQSTSTDLSDLEARLFEWIRQSDFETVAWSTAKAAKAFKVKQDDIYEAMMYIHDHNEKITAVKLSKMLNCTTRTIHRNIGEELKQEKDLLNKQL